MGGWRAVTRRGGMESKRKELIGWTTLIVLSRASDLYATFVVTPDLALETNPVVCMADLGWTGLLCIQTLVAMVLIGLRALDIFAPLHKPNEPDLSFQRFVAWWYMGRPWPAWKCLLMWSVPRTGRAYRRILGYVLVGAVVAAGFWVATAMLITHFWPAAARWYNVKLAGSLSFGRLSPFLVAVPVGLWLHSRSLWSDYRCRRNASVRRCGLCRDIAAK